MCFVGKNCSEDIPECASSPCHYGSTCTEPVVNSYHCQCLPGLQGDNCDHVAMATFDGSSLVSLIPLTVNENRRKRSLDHSYILKQEQVQDPASVLQGIYSGQAETKKMHDYLSRHVRQTESGMVDIRFTFITTVKEGLLLLSTGVRYFVCTKQSSI